MRLPALLLFSLTSLLSLAAWSAMAADELPLVFQDDFEHGADHWQPTDPKAWQVEELDGDHVYSQFQASQYEPPHRSPLNISLLKDVTVGNFQLDAQVQSTARDYGHRDACLFFGYQDPAHFYYVHLAKKADDRANQIFVVNDAPREKITTKSSDGTPWNDEWHHVRIRRDVDSGSIRIFFDDMTTPVMEANDKTFAAGRIGLGSFDDTTRWDDVKLRGINR